MIVHTIPPQMISPLEPIKIALVGIGGTGSLMLARLAQINHSLIAMGHQGIQVTAIDPDKVTKPNIGRQNFIPSDVGQFKSDVLIQRINRTYGFAWKSIPERFRVDKHRDVILITCVDTVKLRAQCHEFFEKHYREKKFLDRHSYLNQPVYWMDIGNGKDFGQVVLGSVQGVDQGLKLAKTSRGMLPTVIDVIPNLASFEKPDQPSCSVAESLFKQDLMVNTMMATWAATLLWDLLTKFRITYHGMYVNLKTYTVNPLPIKSLPWDIKNETTSGQDSTASGATTTTPIKSESISNPSKNGKKSLKKRRGLAEILEQAQAGVTGNGGLAALLGTAEPAEATAELSNNV